MALSGTLDSFALPDVLRLLASTHKTGRLRVTGDLGSGSVWVDGGDIVSTELTSRGSTIDPGPAEIVFRLLRFGSGSFTFEAGAGPSTAAAPDPLEPILVTAEHMLLEWRAIEAVVASLDVFVELAPDPTGGDVMIDATRWRCISAVGGGATVAEVGESMGLGELDVCRTVKDLVELGLLVITEAPSSVDAGYHPAESDAEASGAVALDPADYGAIPSADSDQDLTRYDGAEEIGLVDGMLQDAGLVAATDVVADPAAVADPAVVSDRAAVADPGGSDPDESDPLQHIADDLGLDEFGLDKMVTTTPGLAGLDNRAELGGTELGDQSNPVDSNGQSGTDPNDDSHRDLSGGPEVEVEPAGANMFGAATADEATDSELDPAEMARQLANLSPKAAKAVAAAARASTEAERDEALAAVEAEDDTVNRGLLLKFLGSVDT